MIGLDTNIIVRYLTQDHPIQSESANKIIEKAVIDDEILVISLITLCEVIWVLESCYNSNKKELIQILHALLHTQQIKIENENIVRQALHDFEQHAGVDFPDCLIGRQNISNNCSFTYTFDKKAAKKLHSSFKYAT